MGKFLQDFRFEVISFFTGIAGLIAVAVGKHRGKLEPFELLEICLGTLVTLIPLAVARLRLEMRDDLEASRRELERVFDERIKPFSETLDRQILNNESVLHHYRDISDHMRLINQRREYAITAGFAALLERVPEHSGDCNHLVREISRSVRDISEGRYPILRPSAIYTHDAAELRLLKEGDIYWATYSPNCNPESHASTATETKNAFKSYLIAQKEAAKRGVDVVRLYILEDLTQIPDWLGAQMKDMQSAGIRISLLKAQNLDDDADKCEDFVIIGKRVVGLGEPRRGPMERSVYLFNCRDAVRPEYREYHDFFQSLQAVSVDYVA